MTPTKVRQLCFISFLTLAFLCQYTHPSRVFAGSTLQQHGLLQENYLSLQKIRQDLKSTMKTRSFFEYSPNSVLSVLYENLFDLTEAIHAARLTDEGNYTFLKLKKVLNQKELVSINGSFHEKTLELILFSPFLTNRKNFQIIKNICKRFNSIYLIDNKISGQYLFWSQLISGNVQDPVVKHTLESYRMFKRQGASFQQQYKTEIPLPLKNLKEKLPRFHNTGTPQKIIDMIHHAISHLTYKSQMSFLKNLNKTTPSDIYLLEIFSSIKGLDFSELLRGAHFVINDKGYFYQNLHQSHRVATHIRTSSHYPEDKNSLQFGLAKNSPLFHEVLFGTTIKNKNNMTWFQTEKYGFGKIKEFTLGPATFKIPSSRYLDSLSHLKSFSDHIKSGYRQIGPYGFSSRSEKNNSEIYLTL